MSGNAAAAGQARWLFGSAAAFNFAAALMLALQLSEAEGTNLTIRALAAALVAAFGYAYLRVARDHLKFREFIGLGIVAKTLAVIAIVATWALGSGSGRVLVFAAADAVFVTLFARFRRMTSRSPD